MTGIRNPTIYEAWYGTPRGAWISQLEFSLLTTLLPVSPGSTLLDVGCGTGHFSRLFSRTGIRVTGVDTDAAALIYAAGHHKRVSYVQGSATVLPFADRAFDVCSAITSLCFIDEPERALEEMWRVSRHGIMLGLLNRYSLLYIKKRGRGAYKGARWDTLSEACGWWRDLGPVPEVTFASALWLPGGGWLARRLEPWMPAKPAWGGFLGIALRKES